MGGGEKRGELTGPGVTWVGAGRRKPRSAMCARLLAGIRATGWCQSWKGVGEEAGEGESEDSDHDRRNLRCHYDTRWRLTGARAIRWGSGGEPG